MRIVVWYCQCKRNGDCESLELLGRAVWAQDTPTEAPVWNLAKIRQLEQPLSYLPAQHALHTGSLAARVVWLQRSILQVVLSLVQIPGLCPFLLQGCTGLKAVLSNAVIAPKHWFLGLEWLRAALCTPSLQTDMTEGTCPRLPGCAGRCSELHCSEWPYASKPCSGVAQHVGSLPARRGNFCWRSGPCPARVECRQSRHASFCPSLCR